MVAFLILLPYNGKVPGGNYFPGAFIFIAVPAKWIKTARQYKLNIYSEKPYDLIWEHG